MRRCELEDTAEPILTQLIRAGFDSDPDAFGWWVQHRDDGVFLVYQAESGYEQQVLETRADEWTLLPLVVEPRATVRRLES
jgi:hypothetical protein